MSSCADTIFIDNLEEGEDEEVQFLHQTSEEIQSLQDNNNDDVQIVSEKGAGGKNDEGDENEESIIESLEQKLMNAVVDCQEKAYDLYCEYAHVCGFSVRKGKQYYVQGTKNIRSKVFCCSKPGSKRSESDGGSHEKLDTRTSCKAMVQFEIDKDGSWKVSKLHKEHNHEMAKTYEKHLLRSARRVPKAQGDTLEQMVSSGIKTSQAISYMTKEGGGVASVGFLKKDAYNEFNNRRNSLIEKGDAQSLVNHFKHRASTEGMFFWDVELDDEGRIHNFFWRDGRCETDYDFFGDVVVFDATYRTNKYNLVCAPFIGVNHHWQTVIFACAFLSDESTASFEWAFRSFLESMDNRQPVTFMTNQDAAIMKAADIVFPDSQHRLCLWHICKNAPSYLGALNSDIKFQKIFRKCLTGCETKEEFDKTWAEMINDYNLSGHKWLERLYNLRERWCTALTNEAFSAGFKSTSRSEGTNSVLDGVGSKTTTLTKFVVEFERKLGERRQNEAQADFVSKQGKPPLAVKSSLMLQQAARFYTHKLYKLFEKEFIGILVSSHDEEPCGESTFNFSVTLDTKWGPKTSKVYLDTTANIVNCSCTKFESYGILCTHALAALKAKQVPTIPDKYLLKRWSKDARKRISDMDQAKIFNMEGTGSDIIYTNRAMRFAYDLVSRSQSHEAARLILWQGLESIATRVEDYLKKNPVIDSQSGIKDPVANTSHEGQGVEVDDAATVQDPKKIRTKGRERGERIKGHFEKRQRSNSSKKEASSQGKRKKPVIKESQILSQPGNATNNVACPPVGLANPTCDMNEVPSMGGSFQSFTSMLQGFTALNNSGVGDSLDDQSLQGDNEQRTPRRSSSVWV